MRIFMLLDFTPYGKSSRVQIRQYHSGGCEHHARSCAARLIYFLSELAGRIATAGFRKSEFLNMCWQLAIQAPHHGIMSHVCRCTSHLIDTRYTNDYGEQMQFLSVYGDSVARRRGLRFTGKVATATLQYLHFFSHTQTACRRRDSVNSRYTRLLR